jgi:hypothetical protein
MDSNKGYNQSVSIYPEIYGTDTAEFSYISGSRLREMFVTRKKLDYLRINGYDAFLLDPLLETSEMAAYAAEALERYPYEGDYNVRFLNPDGSRVDFVGDEVTFEGELPPSSCTRPTPIESCKLYSEIGYGSPINFTGSLEEACEALNSGQPPYTPSVIGMQTVAFVVGNEAYSIPGTDCSTVPDGWYLCNYIVGYFVIQILGGKINDIPECPSSIYE